MYLRAQAEEAGLQSSTAQRNRENVQKVWLHFELMLTKLVAIKQQFFCMHYYACAEAFFFHSVSE